MGAYTSESVTYERTNGSTVALDATVLSVSHFVSNQNSDLFGTNVRVNYTDFVMTYADLGFLPEYGDYIHRVLPNGDSVEYVVTEGPDSTGLPYLYFDKDRIQIQVFTVLNEG